MEREELRNLLLTEQAELQKRVDAISRDVGTRTISKQFDEQVVERENDEVLEGLDVEAREELAAISVAMKRLETDHFDRCATCGDTIAEERLKAVPHTVFCIDCAA